MGKIESANLLARSLHEKDLIIYRKYWEDKNPRYLQVDVCELREGDVVFFRHPETLAVLLSGEGNRFFVVNSMPFLKNGIFSVDLKELETTIPDEPAMSHTLETEIIVGKTYLRLV